MIAVALIAAALSTSAPLPGAPADTVQIDSARLAAAAVVIDQIMPPSTRDAMMAGMINAMTKNMGDGLERSPNIKDALNKNPQVRIVMNSFIDRQRSLAVQDLSDNMPALIEAEVRAYAKLYTIDELHEIGAFFASPIGVKYMANTSKILSDPGVAAWQAGVMIRAQKRLPEETKRFLQQISAVMGEGKDHEH